MKKNVNVDTRNKLDSMELSQREKDIINCTDINCIYELFGGLETAEEVEQFISENFPE